MTPLQFVQVETEYAAHSGAAPTRSRSAGDSMSRGPWELGLQQLAAVFSCDTWLSALVTVSAAVFCRCRRLFCPGGEFVGACFDGRSYGAACGASSEV